MSSGQLPARLGSVAADARGRAFLPIVVAGAVILVIPQIWFASSEYTTGLAVQALEFAAYAIGFNLIFGSTNQLFLCVGALAGLGGYATGILSDHASLPIWAGIATGTAAAAFVGGLLSWVAVRRSLGVIFTGIVTLAFSLGFQDLLLGQEHLTGGSTGQVVTGAATSLADTRLGGYYLFAAVVIAFLLVFRLLQISHVGWAFRALRDDETAAELAGVNVARYRIIAAVVGSAMIGLTGALYAYSDGFISPPVFAFDQIDVKVLVLVAFGGLGTLLGPLIGAVVFAFVDNALVNSGQVRELIYGAIVVAIFLSFRRGFVPALVDVAGRFVRQRGSPVKWTFRGRRRDRGHP
ncbi:MAG: branched-chain amino acid ABC transporter permease [Solirubrobacterales bacterium]|nr:branched-chain amino acid ABC transporter permease [Solirubrobacterales bacterium]